MLLLLWQLWRYWMNTGNIISAESYPESLLRSESSQSRSIFLSPNSSPSNDKKSFQASMYSFVEYISNFPSKNLPSKPSLMTLKNRYLQKCEFLGQAKRSLRRFLLQDVVSPLIRTGNFLWSFLVLISYKNCSRNDTWVIASGAVEREDLVADIEPLRRGPPRRDDTNVHLW